MDRNISLARQERGLDLFDEDSLAAHLPDRNVLAPIALRLDENQFGEEAGVGRDQPVGNVLGLPSRQLASSCGDAKAGGH
jgi:hypothetical protein